MDFGSLTVWRDVGGTTQIIKKMTDFWKNLLNSIQCQKFIDKGSWVSWTLVKWLRNYKRFYFENFTQIGVMSDEYFWKVVLRFSQCLKCIDKGSWVYLALVTWLRNYSVFYFGSFTECDVMERPELSRKSRTSGKTYQTLANAKIV